MKKTVYRCFDALGKLIYVGSTLNISQRISCHRSKSDWLFDVSTITLEHFETKQEAYAAEIAAAKTESPKMNINIISPNKQPKIYIDAITKNSIPKDVPEILGEDQKELSELAGKTRSDGMQYLNSLLIRRNIILSFRKNGYTWAAIGKLFGISRQRAQKIGTTS